MPFSPQKHHLQGILTDLQKHDFRSPEDTCWADSIEALLIFKGRLFQEEDTEDTTSRLWSAALLYDWYMH